MRHLLIPLTILSTSAGVVAADGYHALPPRDLPPACRTVAQAPGDARTMIPAEAAAISAASCMATIRLRAVQVHVTPAGITDLDNAMEPSVSLLDAVIEKGDVAAQIVALHALGDLFSGAKFRIMAAAAPGDSNVGALVEPWRIKATAAHREVVRLGATIPDQVATNPVLAFDVADSDLDRAALATR